MPQIGKSLRGHELARDGFAGLVFSAVLVHRFSPFADVTVLRPASADGVSGGEGPSPNYGSPLPVASTSQIFYLSATFSDQAASGTVTLRLQKNGVDTSYAVALIGPVAANGVILPWGVNRLSFLPGDTWSVIASQANPGAGIGSDFLVTAAFYA